jgi:hypothetical protein
MDCFVASAPRSDGFGVGATLLFVIANPRRGVANTRLFPVLSESALWRCKIHGLLRPANGFALLAVALLAKTTRGERFST